MKMQKLLPAAAVVFLTSAGAASATTLQVQGNYSVSNSASYSYAPGFTQGGASGSVEGMTYTSLSSPFTESLALGTTTPATPFFIVNPASCNGRCNQTVTGTVNVDFTFTSPSGTTVSPIVATATYTADYANLTDSIVWTSGTEVNSTTQKMVVDFTDGAVLDVLLIDASDWSILPKIEFDLTADPATATPLPAALPLFAGGLGVLGFAGSWRRRRAAKATASI
jgi:hypothetical protein